MATGTASYYRTPSVTKHPAYRIRDAARVILLDANNNVLMLRGHDEHNPTRHWWFTVGGGLDAGESHKQAAVREVFEETGITLEEGDLVGPVMFRSAIFDFQAEHIVQHETFFVAHLDTAPVLSTTGWTDVEQRFVDDLAWLSVHDLTNATCEVFPENLTALITSMSTGWDGTVIRLCHDQPHTPH